MSRIRFLAALGLGCLLAGPLFADGIINGGSGGSPTGAAGGDLSGSYPNPGVAKIAGTAPGTGVVTALGTNVGSAGAVVVNGGALGTPSSGVGTNLTALNATNLSSGTVAAARLPFNSAVLSTGVGGPTGTTSTSGVMMGLGSTCTITPANSTRVAITIIGNAVNSSTGGYSLSLRSGTGTAPVNTAAPTGTAQTNTLPGGPAGANIAQPFTLTAIATGLTPGTAIWFDVDLAAVTTGTAGLAGLTCSAIEE